MKKLLAAVTLDIQDLIKNYTPEYTCANKRTKFEETLSLHRNQSGKIGVSRWAFAPDNQPFEKNAVGVKFRDDYFCYDDEDTAVKPIAQERKNNIIAMAAPALGRGTRVLCNRQS